MNIYDFGWLDEIHDGDVNPSCIARITSMHKGGCRAITSDGEIHVHLPGNFLKDPTLKLVTGDFIEVGPRFTDEYHRSAATIQKLFPRLSKLSRVAPGGEIKEQVLMANLDFVFIVTSLNDDFSVNRLQRYAILAEQGGITPMIILSKTDLVENVETFIAEIQEKISHVDIFPVSSAQGEGFSKVLEVLEPKVTAAFVGSSGVGKSTMVNYLLQDEVQKTLEVREVDSKGRHATTGRDLFFLPNGAMIIDTAGLREVQVFADEDSLAAAFQEISNLAQLCKFSDCKHSNEPGCAINEALESGALCEDEYAGFVKLQKEALYNERKISKATSSNDKKRWKKTTQNMRARKKFEDSN